jgi:hypothetical protein
VDRSVGHDEDFIILFQVGFFQINETKAEFPKKRKEKIKKPKKKRETQKKNVKPSPFDLSKTNHSKP